MPATPNPAIADPTKDFFVTILTRDISLEDCILDLVDNSVDAARLATGESANPAKINLTGYEISITLGPNQIVVADNCGGMPRNVAEKYAFRFGRAEGAPEVEESIGLYGIGMKRALFKLGLSARVESRTGADAFAVDLDVRDWLSRPDDWKFPIENLLQNAEAPGVTIKILEMREEVARRVSNPSFSYSVRTIIARDYAFLLKSGLRIVLDGDLVRAYKFEVLQTDEYSPVRQELSIAGVEADIIAGFSDLPRDPDEPGAELPETAYYGWFVACNDRIVLAGDKTDKTVWGHDNFTRWHPQYNGFIGIIRLHARETELLPWTTTKRSVDADHPVYREARLRMKEMTRQILPYFDLRRENLEAARAKEATAKEGRVDVDDVRVSPQPTYPRVVAADPTTRISYRVLVTEKERVAIYLGSARMSNRDVGEATFKIVLNTFVDDGEK